MLRSGSRPIVQMVIIVRNLSPKTKPDQVENSQTERRKEKAKDSKTETPITAQAAQTLPPPPPSLPLHSHSHSHQAPISPTTSPASPPTPNPPKSSPAWQREKSTYPSTPRWDSQTTQGAFRRVRSRFCAAQLGWRGWRSRFRLVGSRSRVWVGNYRWKRRWMCLGRGRGRSRLL